VTPSVPSLARQVSVGLPRDQVVMSEGSRFPGHNSDNLRALTRAVAEKPGIKHQKSGRFWPVFAKVSTTNSSCSEATSLEHKNMN
jgi:hypothetical protein